MEADDTQRGIGQRQCRSANLQKTGFEISVAVAGNRTAPFISWRLVWLDPVKDWKHRLFRRK
jgi:hypothetical protein